MDKRTLVIRARRHTGTITALASFFSRKNISVEQMHCSTAADTAEMLCSVTYSCGGKSMDMVPHLVNMHDVIEARYGE